jgi:hypothetical protein
LVDTGVFSPSISRRRRARLEPQVGLMAGHQVFLAAVTVAELRYGALVAGWGDQRRQRLEQSIAATTVVPVSDALLTTPGCLTCLPRAPLRGDALGGLISRGATDRHDAPHRNVAHDERDGTWCGSHSCWGWRPSRAWCDPVRVADPGSRINPNDAFTDEDRSALAWAASTGSGRDRQYVAPS